MSPISIHPFQAVGWFFIGTFSLFALLMILGAYTSFIFSDKNKRNAIVSVILLGLVCIYLSLLLVPSFFDFTKIQIEANGNWVVKNGLGIKLATINTNTARTAQVYEKHVSWYGRPARQYGLANLYIITDKKIYRSWSASVYEANGWQKQLVDQAEIHNFSQSQNNDSVFQTENRLQVAKYIILMIFSVLLFIPVLLEKVNLLEKKL